MLRFRPPQLSVLFILLYFIGSRTNTFYITLRNKELAYDGDQFAYVGEFTSRRKRVGVGEFARRRVDRIPSPTKLSSLFFFHSLQLPDNVVDLTTNGKNYTNFILLTFRVASRVVVMREV